MGMHIILQSLVLVSKIAQFKSYDTVLEQRDPYMVKIKGGLNAKTMKVAILDADQKERGL